MAVTITNVYERKKLAGNGNVSAAGSNCIGYETLGSGSNEKQYRSIIFRFTVGKVCTGLDVNISMGKVGGAQNVPIYGKIFAESSIALNDAVSSVVGTTGSPLLGTVLGSGGEWSTGYPVVGRIQAGFALSPGNYYYLVLYSDLNYGYGCAYYSTTYSTSLVEYVGGVVRIYTGSGGENGWHTAIPHIYTSSGWKQAMPYVYKGSGGENGWHIST